jgi:beta-glucosidase
MLFCDTSLSMHVRAAALVANLTLEEKLDTFMLTGQLKGIPRLNIKSFRWDATDIEGVDDQVFKYNNTCYPHAIGIGATWDRELITEIGQITSIEARVLEEKYWICSPTHCAYGLYIGATNFDGGPLANVAYDPRVGRTSEMYGECPYHTGQVGMTATLALQNKTAVEANGDYFLQTSQVTRHFITDHGSHPDNNAGDYWGDLASLEDEFLPPFKAFQVDGEAEGIMFSISALNGMADTANTYLYDKLIKEWNTSCIRQTDCCGTFRNAVSTHKNFNSTEDAVAAAINAGLQLDYGDNTNADLTNAIQAGKITMQQLDDTIIRTFLVRFRLGEFDETRNPFFMKCVPSPLC